MNGKGSIKKGPLPPGGNWRKFVTHLVTGVLILFLILSFYSLFFEGTPEETVGLSDLARDIISSEIVRISVSGDNLEIEYADGQIRQSKKEIETSLTETLANYGVTSEHLQAIEISVKNPSGVGFWILNILPFALPVVFIVLFLWLLSRQMRGQTMQAFSFGQSRARVIYPDDSAQRITFKDVAGVKEAKEELKEIVDFL